MFKKVKSVLYNKKDSVFYAVVVFLFSSAISSFLTVPLNTGDRYVGGHDFLPPFLHDSLTRDISVITTITNNGYNVSNQVALLVPFRLFYYSVSYIFKINSSTATVILFFTIAFFSQFNSYTLLRYLGKKRMVQSNLVEIIFGIMYFFCPFVVSLLIPGHVLQLFIYAFLPIIIKNLDEYLSEQRLISKNVINIFLLSFLCATSFFNYAVMASSLLLLVAYTIALFHQTEKLYLIFRKLLIVIITVVVANLWWLLPSFLNIQSFGELNNTSYLNNYEDIATKYATYTNIFTGTPDPMLHLDEVAYLTPYNNTIFVISFLFFFSLFIYGVIYQKNPFLIAVISLMLFFAFLSKGSQRPFGSFFSFAYDNLFGFKMFRRPVSKFYPIYWLLFIMSTFLICTGIKNRGRSMFKTFFLLLLAGVLLLNFIFFQLRPKTMYTFSVPSYYEDSRIYLQQDDVNSAIVLPSSGGFSPDLGSEFNYYKGLDILPSVWAIPTLYPDLYGASPDYLYKKILNRIYSQIALTGDICIDTKDLGITHIIWRNDTTSAGDGAIEYKKLLLSNSAVRDKKTFGEIDVYSLKDDCRGALLMGSGEKSSIKLLNSKPHSIGLFKPKNVSSIRLSKDYNSNWRLIKVEENVVNNNLLTEITGIINNGTSPNFGSYYNEWSVVGGEGFYLIYYYSQKFVYIGALISILYLLFICIVSRKQGDKKYSSI